MNGPCDESILDISTLIYRPELIFEFVSASNGWLMSVKLNYLPKLEKSRKNSNFNGKTIPYPGFEPGTSGSAAVSHNHWHHWVG
jgi:hypothetical protein